MEGCLAYVSRGSCRKLTSCWLKAQLVQAESLSQEVATFTMRPRPADDDGRGDGTPREVGDEGDANVQAVSAGSDFDDLETVSSCCGTSVSSLSSSFGRGRSFSRSSAPSVTGSVADTPAYELPDVEAVQGGLERMETREDSRSVCSERSWHMVGKRMREGPTRRCEMMRGESDLGERRSPSSQRKKTEDRRVPSGKEPPSRGGGTWLELPRILGESRGRGSQQGRNFHHGTGSTR